MFTVAFKFSSFSPIKGSSLVLTKSPTVESVAYKSVCASYRDSLGVDRVGTVVFAKPDEQERFSFNGSVIFEGQRDNLS